MDWFEILYHAYGINMIKMHRFEILIVLDHYNIWHDWFKPFEIKTKELSSWKSKREQLMNSLLSYINPYMLKWSRLKIRGLVDKAMELISSMLSWNLHWGVMEYSIFFYTLRLASSSSFIIDRCNKSQVVNFTRQCKNSKKSYWWWRGLLSEL